MRKQSLILVWLLTLIPLMSIAQAEEYTFQPPKNGSISASINPLLFGAGGYSVKGFYHFVNRWSLGLTLEGGLTSFELVRDEYFTNNGDIDVDWSTLYNLEVRYRLNKKAIDEGFYLDGTIGINSWNIREMDNNLEENLAHGYLSVGLGYTWYPFKKKRLNITALYSLYTPLSNYKLFCDEIARREDLQGGWL